MKEDERIQQQVEKGIKEDGVDAEAYRLVFRALKKEETLAKLPDDFGSRVSTLAFAKRKSFDWDKLFLLSGLFALLGALGYSIAATEFALSLGAFQFLSNYSYFVIFAIVVVGLLQWIDKKILKTTNTQF